jgi:hypothetical protein
MTIDDEGMEFLARAPGCCIPEPKYTQIMRRNVKYEVHQSGGLLVPSLKIPMEEAEIA